MSDSKSKSKKMIDVYQLKVEAPDGLTDAQLEDWRKLINSTQLFSGAVLARLYQKVQEGRSGWDGTGAIWLAELEGKIENEAQLINWLYMMDPDVLERRCADLAAFCMFRWHISREARGTSTD
jgi:hypothetical protein